MRTLALFFTSASLCLGTLLLSPSLLAQTAPSPSSQEVQVTVTAYSSGGATPPALEKIDISVHQDKQPRPVVALIPAKEPRAGLALVVLVDDSLDTSVGSQLADLAQFIRTLPANSRVAVAYTSNGMATMQQGFTADREAAAKALRLPRGEMGGPNGLYFALADLIKKWPAGAGRREVLVISHGIDLTYGVAESTPGQNLALEQAIAAAQRNNVTIFSLYAEGTGFIARNLFLISNGQGCLSDLTLETGGDSFFEGLQTPVSFQPFLQTLSKLLGQQYLLTFQAVPGKQAGFHDLRVSTEMSHVGLLAPTRIYLPAAK